MSNKFTNLKEKFRNGYYKSRIFISDPKMVASLMPVLKAAKKKDYRTAITILSQNPQIQEFIVKHEDKIKSILMRYGGEIKYILELIESMKSFNQVYEK